MQGLWETYELSSYVMLTETQGKLDRNVEEYAREMVSSSLLKKNLLHTIHHFVTLVLSLLFILLSIHAITLQLSSCNFMLCLSMFEFNLMLILNLPSIKLLLRL